MAHPAEDTIKGWKSNQMKMVGAPGIEPGTMGLFSEDLGN